MSAAGSPDAARGVLERPELEPVAEVVAGSRDHPLAGRSVLVVEHPRRGSGTLADMLRALGAEVFHAPDTPGIDLLVDPDGVLLATGYGSGAASGLADLRGAVVQTRRGSEAAARIVAGSACPVIDLYGSQSERRDHVHGALQEAVASLTTCLAALVGATLAGSVSVVCGYGPAGQGAADGLRGMGARVVVTERDPGRAADAALAGFRVAVVDDVVRRADVFLAATRTAGAVSAADLAAMRDGAIVGALAGCAGAVDLAGAAGQYDAEHSPAAIVRPDGSRLHVAGALGPDGARAGLRPPTTWALAGTVLALLELASGHIGPGVHRAPVGLDDAVARAHGSTLGIRLTR